MSKRIVIDPVTRIEGHAKISIFMDESGQVSDAEFHMASGMLIQILPELNIMLSTNQM